MDNLNEQAAYDSEWVVILDDRTDGLGHRPNQILATRGFSAGLGGSTAPAGSGSMAGMSGAGSSALLGGYAGDAAYPR